MTLAQLHDGIDIPEYATRVPWLITQPELYGLVPPEAFTASPGDWPMLRFTLLGVTATFGFNFRSHPEGRLLGVDFNDPDEKGIDERFRGASVALLARLGDPNDVNMPEYHHLMWRDEHVWVDHSAGVPENPEAVRRHKISVYYHAGKPQAWVASTDRTLTQVKRLLNLMPEVEVTTVWRTPAGTSLGLSVRSFSSLARLAHVAAWANVRFQVGVDEYREANGGLKNDDPAGIRFGIEIPGPREPEPNGHSTTLQILGSYLVDDLREQGLLEKEEADRLIGEFNNHEGCDGQAREDT